jgi:hypothetical protein
MITTFRCEGFKSKEECDEYWNIPPICDENTPPGTTCRDEGDPDDCEEGFIDKGNGCEPIEEEEEKPPIECPYYGYVNTGDKCVPIEEEGTDGEGIPFVNEPEPDDFEVEPDESDESEESEDETEEVSTEE